MELNPKRCNLGIFYGSAPAPKGLEKTWEKIGEFHQRVHEGANDVYSALDSKDMSLALSKFDEIRSNAKN